MDELLRLLTDAVVRYVVIGGQAMRLAGMPRFSIDWDLFIPPHDMENMDRLNRVLADSITESVLPLGPRGENFVQTLQTPRGVLQFHLGVPGLPSFDEVEKRSVVVTSDRGNPIRCLCGEDLLRSKKAAGRPEDQADIAFLEEKKRMGTL